MESKKAGTMQIVNGIPYLPAVGRLIRQYAAELGRDLSFQSFEAELDDLPAKYAGGQGELLAAVSERDGVVGCVAYHRHSDTRCEMKRLYVKPEYRRERLGGRLVEAILCAAQRAGYREMVLDTIEPLQSAVRLYEAHGFRRIEPYYHNPMPDVIYMGRPLRPENEEGDEADGRSGR